MSVFKLDDDDLEFHVVLWNDKRNIPGRTLAAAVGISIARAAYFETLRHYEPDRNHVILKHGMRVICDSENPRHRIPDVPGL